MFISCFANRQGYRTKDSIVAHLLKRHHDHNGTRPWGTVLFRGKRIIEYCTNTSRLCARPLIRPLFSWTKRHWANVVPLALLIVVTSLALFCASLPPAPLPLRVRANPLIVFLCLNLLMSTMNVVRNVIENVSQNLNRLI